MYTPNWFNINQMPPWPGYPQMFYGPPQGGQSTPPVDPLQAINQHMKFLKKFKRYMLQEAKEDKERNKPPERKTIRDKVDWYIFLAVCSPFVGLTWFWIFAQMMKSLKS